MQTLTYIPYSYILQFTPNKVDYEIYTRPVSKCLPYFAT